MKIFQHIYIYINYKKKKKKKKIDLIKVLMKVINTHVRLYAHTDIVFLAFYPQKPSRGSNFSKC
jgi:hypothetical protein